MHIEIIGDKRHSAERVFLCNWMELCGYMVINREHALDLPVNMRNITINQAVVKGIRIGQGYNRIVLEIEEGLIREYDTSVLYQTLVEIMNFIGQVEQDEEMLYYEYQDDRAEVMEFVAWQYIQRKVYLHIFTLNRTYSTGNILFFSVKKIVEVINVIKEENAKRRKNNYFLNFVIILLYSRLRKAQKFLNLISWDESEKLIKQSDLLLSRMKMSHYQDTLYLIKSHIYETVPGESDKMWANLRRIKNGHYYVSYQLGFAKEKYWTQKEDALKFYHLARIEMPEYYRADYKIAFFHEEQGRYDLAEHMYRQVIMKIWGAPREKWIKEDDYIFDDSLYDKKRARYFTMLDVEYLLKSWNRLFRTLHRDDSKRKRYEYWLQRYKKYIYFAELNYNYMEDGIKNSEFLDGIFLGNKAEYENMAAITLRKLRKGREELRLLEI